jgi:hypothetical protein
MSSKLFYSGGLIACRFFILGGKITVTIDEAKEIIRKTKSPYLKRDMEKFIKRTQKKLKEKVLQKGD